MKKTAYDNPHTNYRWPWGLWLHRLAASLWCMAAVVAVSLPRGTLMAQTPIIADTLNIRFALDSTNINMDFEGNRQRWNKFESLFNQHFSHLPAASLRLDIYAGASPEGTPTHNQWLGENRGQAIRRLVRQRLGQHIGNIVVHNEGARWDAFYESVAASEEPWRDEVLRIIDMPSTANPDRVDQREVLLRRLHGGRVWSELEAHHLAPLRSGVSAVLTWVGARDTIVVRDTVVMKCDTVVMMVPVTTVVAPPDGTAGKVGKKKASDPRRDSLRNERLRYPAWAVKTNMLMWGVVAPNIQVELPLGHTNRWSIEAEYFVPWFTWSHNAQAHQFHNLGLELRCYLGRRDRHRWLQGWHIGIAAAAGYYDWEWKKHKGYQGEYVNGYLNVGYQHRWGEHWGLDMGAGFGAMTTKYRHYYGGSVYPANHLEPSDEHLIWHDSGHYHWIGPNHAHLSIVYFFNKNKKIKQ